MKRRVHNQLGQDHQQKYFFRGTERLKSKMGSQRNTTKCRAIGCPTSNSPQLAYHHHNKIFAIATGSNFFLFNPDAPTIYWKGENWVDGPEFWNWSQCLEIWVWGELSNILVEFAFLLDMNGTLLDMKQDTYVQQLVEHQVEECLLPGYWKFTIYICDIC